MYTGIGDSWFFWLLPDQISSRGSIAALVGMTMGGEWAAAVNIIMHYAL